MVTNLEESILKSKALLDAVIPPPYAFTSYCKSYLFTTENIRGCISDLDVTPKSALTVLASGDQVFNLAAVGTSKIDAFDINFLSYYFFWLKFSIIMSFSYKRFHELAKKGFYLKDPRILEKILNESHSNMPKDVYEYFKAMIDYQRYAKGGLKELIHQNESYDKDRNLYANSPKLYERLQKVLEQIQLEFYFDDARVIPRRVNGPYDLILLSNITDYFGTSFNHFQKDSFDDYLGDYYDLLNEGGSVINYLFYRYDFRDRVFHAKVIDNSDITLEDLGFQNITQLDDDEGFYRLRKPKINK